ncbi:hypothetical protein ACIOKD_09980 [Streptomyces sp. NPDC087844]
MIHLLSGSAPAGDGRGSIDDMLLRSVPYTDDHYNSFRAVLR